MLKKFICLVICFLFIFPSRAFSHPFGYLRIDAVSQISISADRITLQYLLRLPEASAFSQLKIMDKNQDFIYTDEEKKSYLDLATEKVLENITMKLNEQALNIKTIDSKVIVNTGTGELSTLKVNYLFEASVPEGLLRKGENNLYFHDDNFTSTPGWKEIMVKGEDSVTILSAPEKPENIKNAVCTKADIVFSSVKGSVGGNINEFSEPNIPETQGDNGLVGLITKEKLNLSVVLVALGLAVILGALHAFAPGHGKTIVGAYLIGSRGTIKHAVLLGIIVTFTHTISVILLGLICLFAFKYVMPEKLYPWIGFSSGILISIIGIWLFIIRQKEAVASTEQGHSHDHEHGHNHSHDHSHKHDLRHENEHDHIHGHEHDHSHDHSHKHDHEHTYGHSQDQIHGHEHDHSHKHDHEHTHEHSQEHSHENGHDHGHSHEHTHDHSSHEHAHEHRNHEHGHVDEAGGHYHGGKYHVHKLPEKITLLSLIALGVSGGIVPCPDALVVLLSAVALNRIILGLLVIVAFSLGLAAVLIAIGIVMVTAGKMLEKYYPKRNLLNRVAAFSYLFIFILGLVIAIQSLTSAGILVINI
ncbi:MAG: sulfite exporter TauE/SafE family protein [Candidatus Eremiobacterota bacterium]